MSKRQIVFIMTDTTRWDMLGCYGNPDMKTPNLDALAAQGVRFDRAYTCQPVCGPARAAIFTGLYPHSAGSWANCMALGSDARTVGQHLTDYGIHTAYIGKWHLDASDYFGTGKCPVGWDPDYWYDMRNYLEELTPEQREASRNAVTADGSPVTSEYTFAHRVTDRAVDFIRRFAQEDFFLTVSYDEPHGPCMCPEPFASMYEGYDFPKSPNFEDSLADKPAYQRIWAQWPEAFAKTPRNEFRIRPSLYLGCNSYADQQIGRVLEAVNRMTPDAMIVFTSDHGDGLYAHGNTGKGPSAYDEIVRIPLIIKGGALAPSPVGVATDQPVTHLDMAGMIYEYMNVPMPRWMDGKSMLPAVIRPEARMNERIFFEFNRFEFGGSRYGSFHPMRAVFDGRYKLAVHLLEDTDEFYDLKSDPYEMHNLIHDEASACTRDALHDAILKEMDRTNDPFRGYYWLYRPWRRGLPAPSWRFTGATRYMDKDHTPRQLDYLDGQEVTPWAVLYDEERMKTRG